MDFGITGLDMIEEKRGENGDIIILHDALGFGSCALTLAVPESWTEVKDLASLKRFSVSLPGPLRVDGIIQPSQAALIANRKTLQTRPEALEMARRLLEYIEAHSRAKENLLVIANMRGENPQAIAQKMFTQTIVGGLQGPTISPVIVRDGETNWYSATVVVRRDLLPQAITELRAIGGSGIIVSPVTYIFEEEPPRYKAMLSALEQKNHA